MTFQWSSAGVTIRDYFAAKAMQATVANDSNNLSAASAAEMLGIETKDYDFRKHWPILVAQRAYSYADAMLAAREVQP